jgi:hypothetical protein
MLVTGWRNIIYAGSDIVKSGIWLLEYFFEHSCIWAGVWLPETPPLGSAFVYAGNWMQKNNPGSKPGD